jgi:hypothetical protein
MNAIHARYLSNPQKQMLKAIAIAAILIVFIFVLPTLEIAAFSPPLDEAGNIVRGQLAVTDISQKLELNIFKAANEWTLKTSIHDSLLEGWEVKR